MTPASGHPAAFHLKDIERTAGVLLRALGNERELRVVASNRNHAVRVGNTLRLPMEFAQFDSAALNRELYLWLIALAASDAHLVPEPPPELKTSLAAWIVRNRNATRYALSHFPGLRGRYQRLSQALHVQRAPAAALSALEAQLDAHLHSALQSEDAHFQAIDLPLEHDALPLIPLWLYPPAARTQQVAISGNPPATRLPPHKDPFTTPRSKPAPSLIASTRANQEAAEFIKVDDPQAITRDQQSEERRNPQALGRDGATQDSRRHFEYDLPETGHEDTVIAAGIPLPEWDYRKRILRPDQCFVQEIIGRHTGGQALPEHLRKHAQRLRQQFATLMPLRHWLRAQSDGTEPDIDACVRAYADSIAGSPVSSQDLYLVQQQHERDLSCLVLADLSLSTDAWVTHNQRVIDVIRDSLLLFAEALSASGDRFGLYGFSSHKREQVNFHRFKDFLAPYDPIARGRISAIRPGHYTRMGAAIRHASNLLEQQPSALRLLLILSDGRPHDIDYYGERFGIEDTRMALIEARRKRIRPFCITIDREGSHYLPHLFGVNGYTVLRRPEELSERLPLLYTQITSH